MFNGYLLQVRQVSFKHFLFRILSRTGCYQALTFRVPLMARTGVARNLIRYCGPIANLAVISSL